MVTTYQHGYALLIGVDENSAPDWALPDIAKDIDALRDVITHPQRCGYPADHVRLIKGPEATRQKILDGLEWLQGQVAADASGNATAVIYYSGHGWRDPHISPPNFYLIPYDVRKDKLRSTALRAEDFAEAVEAVQPQRLLVVLDCCHAGGMDVKDLALATGQFEPAALPPDLLLGSPQGAAKSIDERGLEQLAVGAGRAVLSSSTGLQKSYVRSDHTMSIFTYHLVEALTGYAQPQEGASEVLVSDILSYVYRQVPQSAKQDGGHEQQPDGRITGNFPVALLLGGKGLSKGEAAPDPLAALPSTVSITIGKIGAAIGQGAVASGAGGVAVGGDVHGGVKVGGVDTGGSAYIGGNVNTSGGDFVGRDKTVHGDLVYGDKVGGDKVKGDKITVGNVSGTGTAIGRNARATVTTDMDSAALSAALAPVAEAVRQSCTDAAVQAQGLQMVEELKQELSKGKDRSDDSHVARLLKGLSDLVPGAVSAVVSAFATPVLAGLAGPTTKFLLDSVLGHK